MKLLKRLLSHDYRFRLRQKQENVANPDPDLLIARNCVQLLKEYKFPECAQTMQDLIQSVQDSRDLMQAHSKLLKETQEKLTAIQEILDRP